MEPLAATAGGNGATCGGIGALPCASGYTCVLVSIGPRALGSCHRVSGEGGRCGGAIRFPAVCGVGVHCEFPAGGSRQGAIGTCIL